MDDMELVQRYAERHCEEAFATLVSRHIDLVYSTALRHIGNHHQAEEIAQAVFVTLARKAPALSPATVLPGWLFHTTRLTASNYLRTEIRRSRREQEAYMQSDLNQNSADDWQDVSPLLNDAIAALREKDRDAIVLRFLQNKDFKQVAAALGGSEEAAQMRVSRALEKLRKLFAKRGVALPAATLGALIAAHATHAAPVGLATSVAASAFQTAALTASKLGLLKGALNLMASTKVNCIAAVSVVILLGYQHRLNTVQARQLTVARPQAIDNQQSLQDLENQISDLARQTTAIIQNRREQEQELARLRARRQNTGNNQSKQTPTPPTTLLAATLQDPIAREALQNEILNNFRNRWEPLVKQLKLSSDDADKLYQIGSNRSMKDLDSIADFSETKTPPADAIQQSDQHELDAKNQLRLLLGPDAMAKFDECEHAFPARSLVSQYEQVLGFFGMTPEQHDRFYNLIQAEPYSITDGLAGSFTVRELVIADDLDRRFEQQAATNQRILQAASEFLSADQLDALKNMQIYNLSAQKRTVLRSLRKL